jgi:CheY-like chemotaxis protein
VRVSHANKQVISDSLSLPAGHVTTILEKRDKQECKYHGQNLRLHPRHIFHRHVKLVITTFSPDGSSVRYAVAARNLSEMGAAFLHGASLTQNTACVISMCNHNKQWINVVAKVVRSTRIESHVYEIGVQLVNRVDIRSLVDQTPSHTDSAHELPHMVGRVLCVLENYDDRCELRNHLTRMGVTCVMTNQGQQAIALVQGDVPFDLVIADKHLSDMDSKDLIDQLHERGHTEPVILLVEQDEQDDAMVLTKPLKRESLAALLLQWLALSPARSQSGDDSMFGPRQRMEVHMALMGAVINDTRDNRLQLSELCLKIQALACQCGSGRIAIIAGELAQQIMDDDSPQDYKDQCNQLAALFKSAKKGPKG